jgi:hypothetical protein
MYVYEIFNALGVASKTRKVSHRGLKVTEQNHRSQNV